MKVFYCRNCGFFHTWGEEKSKEDETLELFEKLAQPRIKKAIKEETLKIKEDIKGYKESERNDLDRLIDSVE